MLAAVRARRRARRRSPRRSRSTTSRPPTSASRPAASSARSSSCPEVAGDFALCAIFVLVGGASSGVRFLLPLKGLSEAPDLGAGDDRFAGWCRERAWSGRETVGEASRPGLPLALERCLAGLPRSWLRHGYRSGIRWHIRHSKLRRSGTSDAPMGPWRVTAADEHRVARRLHRRRRLQLLICRASAPWPTRHALRSSSRRLRAIAPTIERVRVWAVTRLGGSAPVSRVQAVDVGMRGGTVAYFGASANGVDPSGCAHRFRNRCLA